MTKWSFMVLLVFCLIGSFPVAAQEWEQWPGEGALDHPKIATVLEDLISNYQAQHPLIKFDILRRAPLLHDLHREGNRIRVVIEAESATTASKIAAAVKQAGGEIELSYGTQLQAMMPIGGIQKIADMRGVQFIRLPVRPVLDQGAIVSEGQKLIGAPTWNKAGLDGRGVKVGVIDPEFYRYERLLGRELPSQERVVTKSFRRDGEMFDPEFPGSHGVAVAEIVNDVAPGVSLNLAAVDTDVEFRQAVDWMIKEQVDVINTSGGYASGCFRGPGLFEPQIQKAREAGITWVTSAGNLGDSHWEGTFLDNSGNNVHEFSGSDETLSVEVEFVEIEGIIAAAAVAAFLSWDAPCTGASDDYDLEFVFESQPQLRRRADWVWKPGIPVKGGIYIVFTPNLGFVGRRDFIGLRVMRKRAAAPPARLDIAIVDCLKCHTIEYRVSRGSVSIFEPAISPNALAVGAFHQAPARCPRNLCPETNLLVYSSRGPTKDNRIKPDITAPAHVSTSTYGQYTGDGPNQNSGFDGTSASAPHVAGAVALIKQAFPKFTPQQIQEFLSSRAEDRGARGKDNDWGAGQLLLGEVVIIPNAPANLVAVGSGPREIALSWQDQADNEAGFSLERRFSLDPDFSEIARLAPDSTTFSDTNVLPETTYCYRVRSFTESGQSDYSNESCTSGTADLALYEFSAAVQPSVFTRIELPNAIKDALPVGVRFVEEPNVTVGNRTSHALDNVNLQLSPSTGSIFGTPIGSGEFPFLLAVFSNGHKLARIWVVLTIKPAANLARRTTQPGSPPQLLFIDFPAQIRATGTPITGFVGFSDPDGDLVKAEFTVVRATEFQNFQVTPGVQGRKEGAFPFEIATTVSQHVTLSVTLIDEAGQTSQPVAFSFEALLVPVLRVSPERLNQQGIAGLGQLPPLEIEISNVGSGLLTWTALTDAPWLTISPQAGETVAGEKSLLTATAANVHLRAGLHRALVMIRAPGAQNSPQWVGFLLELTPAGGSLRWQAQIGPTDFSPALGTDGTIYIAGDDQSLHALSPDGQIRWAFRASQPILSASAAIAPNGTIYFGAEDGNLYALTPDGKEKWRFTGDLPIRSSPAIGPDGTIYIGSGSQSSEDAKVYALQPNGTLQARPFDTEGGVVSSPAISATGVLYVGALDRRVYAINLHGFYRQWRFRTDGSVSSSPAIGSDGTVYVGSFDGHLYALAPDGREKWRFQTNDGIVSSPAIGPDGTVYIGSLDHFLYAVKPDGQEKWRFRTEGPVHSSPAIAADGVVYIGSDDGNLYAVNPDGTKRWSFKTGGEIRSSPVISDDGTIYVVSHDGRLYAIRGEAGPADSPWPMFRHNAQRTGLGSKP